MRSYLPLQLSNHPIKMPLTTMMPRGCYAQTKEGIGRRTYLHGVDQHPRQSERNALGKLAAIHRHLEAVSKVDMKNLCSDGIAGFTYKYDNTAY